MADKPLTVVFEKDQTLSPDGVHNREYKKGEAFTAHTNIERRVFENMLERGLAKAHSPQAKSPGQKVQKPKETKVTKKGD